MKIQIHQKHILFSKKPGTKVLLPGSSFSLELFPTKIQWQNLEGTEKGSLRIDTKGVVQDFEVRLDLEKGRVEVSGKAKIGFFRLHLFTEEKAICLALAKGPKEGLFFSSFGVLYPKQKIELIKGDFTPLRLQEKLSFGAHKALDISQIEKRSDLKEVLPLLYSLAQQVVCKGKDHREGMAKYLEFSENRAVLLQQFEDLFKGGFTSFVPRLDDEFQGYLSFEEKIAEGKSPLVILKTIGQKIRELFFYQKEDSLFFMQTLLQPFVCGRIMNVQCPPYGKVSFEWTERRLRKIVFTPCITAEVKIFPPKDIRHFRVRKGSRDKGKIYSSGASVSFTENTPVYFDRFEK